MNIYEELAKIADDLHGEGPEFPFDNGGTKDGWNMACRKIAEEIRSRDKSMGLASEPSAPRALSAEEMRERAATVADGFTCGGCGMDGKAGAAIRALPTLSGEAK